MDEEGKEGGSEFGKIWTEDETLKFLAGYCYGGLRYLVFGKWEEDDEPG